MSSLSDIDSELQEILEGEFSEPVAITVAGYTKQNLYCIFDETSLVVDPDSGEQVVSDESQIGIYIKSIDDNIGSTLNESMDVQITIRGKNYGLKEVLRDGTNFARLVLKL